MNENTFNKIANVSEIDFTADETAKFIKELDGIIGFVRKVGEFSGGCGEYHEEHGGAQSP